MPEVKEKAETVETVMQRIVKLSGIDDSMIPVGRGFAWFGNYDERGQLGPPIVLKLGERSPFNKRMGIVAMFQNETEVRMYAVPLEKPEKNEIATPTRHTLSKTAPTFFFEALPHDVFEAEIADELCELDENTAAAITGDDGTVTLVRPKDLQREEEEEEEEKEEKEPNGAAPDGEPASGETTPPAS
jgi:hypothetical protein